MGNIAIRNERSDREAGSDEKEEPCAEESKCRRISPEKALAWRDTVKWRGQSHVTRERGMRKKIRHRSFERARGREKGILLTSLERTLLELPWDLKKKKKRKILPTYLPDITRNTKGNKTTTYLSTSYYI